MPPQTAQACELTSDDLEKLMARSSRRHFPKDSQVFAEGDTADAMYVIESGRVSVVIQEFTKQEDVSSLGPGEYFGEMAFFSGDKRAATVVASADSILHCLGRQAFLDIYESDPGIAAKFDRLVDQRNSELRQKETLIDASGAQAGNLHIGIKGDPSLRESAFTRERYESIADKYLPALQSQLYDLLLNRGAYDVSIHFNSGEIHVRTIFNPLIDEIHPANKLVNKGYIDRHFHPIDYERKCDAVRHLYGLLAAGDICKSLPPQTRGMLCESFARWEPVTPAEITRILAKLPLLRRIQNFYIRNFTISTLRNVIRMQFNCDGAHIVNIEQFESFLADNILLDEPELGEGGQDRRNGQRRSDAPAAGESHTTFERRTPPGRRKEDWENYVTNLQAAPPGRETENSTCLATGGPA